MFGLLVLITTLCMLYLKNRHDRDQEYIAHLHHQLDWAASGSRLFQDGYNTYYKRYSDSMDCTYLTVRLANDTIDKMQLKYDLLAQDNKIALGVIKHFQDGLADGTLVKDNK